MSDEPVAGFYKTRLVRGGPFVAVKIYWGQPLDEDGEVMERHMRWVAIVDGRMGDIERMWPWCGRFPIPESEYNFMVDKGRWAKAHAPERAEASPHEKIDFNSMPPFFKEKT